MTSGKQIVILGLAAASLALVVVFFSRLDRGVRQLSAEQAALRSEISSLRNDLRRSKTAAEFVRDLSSAPTNTAAQVEADARPAPDAAPQASGAPPNPFGFLFSGMQKSMANLRLSEIEDAVTITDEQRERLRAALEEESSKAAGLWNGTSTNEISAAFERREAAMKEILGEEKYKAVKQAEDEKIERRKQDRLDNRVAAYTAKLDLKPEQQQAVRKAIEEVDAGLDAERVKWVQESGAFKIDENGDAQIDMSAAMSQSMQLIQREKAFRDRSLAEKLKGTLSDDQYNKLLEQQAVRGSILDEIGFPPGN